MVIIDNQIANINHVGVLSVSMATSPPSRQCRRADCCCVLVTCFVFFGLLVLELAAADLGEVMHGGKLQQAADDEPETHYDEPVERRCVVNFRQVISRVH